MDEDSRGGLDSAPGIEPNDNVCKPNKGSGEFVAANIEVSSDTPKEVIEERARANPEGNSDGHNEVIEEHAMANSEPSNINQNKVIEEHARANPEGNSDSSKEVIKEHVMANPELSNISPNEVKEEQSVANTEGNSDSPKEVIEEHARANPEGNSDRPKEGIEEHTRANPEGNSVRPKEVIEEHARANTEGNSDRPKEVIEEHARANPEGNSDRPKEVIKEHVMANPESSNINPNKVKEEHSVANPEDNSDRLNKVIEEHTRANPEGNSDKPKEVIEKDAHDNPEGNSDRPNTFIEEHTRANPEDHRDMPNEVIEEHTRANPEDNSDRPNEVIEEHTRANPEDNSDRPNEVIEEHAHGNPENNSDRPNEVIEAHARANPKDNCDRPNEVIEEHTRANPEGNSDRPKEVIEEHARANTEGNSDRPNEVIEEHARANPEYNSDRPNEVIEEHTRANPEDNSDRPNEVIKEHARANPEDNSDRPNEVIEEHTRANPEGNSDRPKEVIEEHARANTAGNSDRPKEIIKEHVMANPEPSNINPNEVKEEHSVANSEDNSDRSNEVIEEYTRANPEGKSDRPKKVIEEHARANTEGNSDGPKEHAMVNPKSNSIKPNEDSEKVIDTIPPANSLNDGIKELAKVRAGNSNTDLGFQNKGELRSALPCVDSNSRSNSSGPSNVYRPPPMRARQRKQDGVGPVSPTITDASVPTVPTFEQFILQQAKEKKRKGPCAKENSYPSTSSSIIRSNQSSDRNEYPQRKRQQNTVVRDMSCNVLAEISRSESVIILEKINRQKESFKKLIESPPSDRSRDVFALVFELVTNVWKSSFEESKKLLLLEICNSNFIDNLQLYLMQLPYTESRRDKLFNKYYWTKEREFWSNFMTFCECVINVSPATAVRKCGSLIEATSKSCLDGLKEKHDFDLPEDYTNRMTNLRDRLKRQTQIQKKSDTSAAIEPLENFRELSVMPTGAELLERRPFLRPNVVEGAYSDVEHYLDVQFRLLREDCFGPLREGIHQYIEDPKKRKYDHIRVYRNVKFMGPFFTKQKFGSLVLLDQYTEKMFKKMNWKQSKRFLFGSLVLFTKDHCKSFLVGTILQRDEELLSKRLLGVSIIDSAMNFDLYNEDLYTMIECEVYFEPYHHVLKALQDPNFPEHLAMSKYIVGVQKAPEKPAYLTQDPKYTLNKKCLFVIERAKFDYRNRRNRRGSWSSDEDEIDELSHLHALRSRNCHEGKFEFSVLQDETWPTETELGLNSSQYEAYKLAITREFAVIQGPPGTGKTFLGVKVAKTLLENVSFLNHKCCMLLICYTNHALDQFLEALLPVTDSIVRIGGRSQSKLLEKYNITNIRGWACFEQRSELEYRIRKLQDFYEACISPEVLLSYRTVFTYTEECRVVHEFYKGQHEDALKHWLFENVESCEGFSSFRGQVKNNANNKTQEKTDVDNDIYDREDLGIDDDDEIFYRKMYGSTLVSFSLSEAEQEKNELVNNYHKTKEGLLRLEDQDLYGFQYEKYCKTLQDLEHNIFQLHSHISVFKDMMTCQSRPPGISLANVKDLSKVPLIERWSFYYKWANIAKAQLKKQAKKREELVQSAAEAYEEARMMSDRSLLRGTRVVGMTTSAAARLRKLLVEVAPAIVIVEEAAEVLEAHIVASLTKNCQHLILIGDHQQLRPSAAYLRLARHYQLEVSLFERMIRNGVHSRRLGVQHRMRPEIAALVSPHIYPELQNHRSVEDFPPVRGVAHNLFFFSHNYMEQSEDDNSTRTNTLEADLTLRLANYLMQQGYKPDEVTIVAAYSGQMFYMRRQRSMYDHLSDVKITVLDNYQGEESKIILLSLVRNNNNNSIGFLGTENRICVALSRAREGFFILGNMELLKRNSTLWTNIAQTLADNGSLGSTLTLKCENHAGQTTTITSVEDFVKVPEGGCLLDCKYKLPSCGHPCPRMCHAYDIAHGDIFCTRDCERKICEIEGHNCPLPCSKKCQPCMRYMDKLLSCGHTRPVLCYIPHDHSTVYCEEEVVVTLPDCGHKATKPCSKRISDVYCMEKCEAGRLRCGHACILRCHVNNDPDHENYKCEKACPRQKSGCTANLEGDLGDHQCPLLCGDTCLPCDIQVTKKRSGCKHSKQVACREDVNDEPCRMKCARSLPCGHHCKKLCFEKCGDCKQRVKKTIPDCNHEIEIECGTEPTREHCKEKCERTMDCGHSCPARCHKPCDQATCTEITGHSSEAPCGHSVKLPCNVHQAMQTGSVPVATLLAVCSAPCGALLRCGHVCAGSCSGCRQGRLHQPCAARCHQLNICGHRCEEPCNQVCPPCRRRCSVRCLHSACGRPCGAPCTPCTETPCGRSCEHSVCTRACGAPCSRAPCEEACPRTLRCGHGCRGLCGEPCPPVCRLCDPDGFPTDLLGDQYEDDAKLIQLQDCPHILDVDTLDTLMNSDHETIQIKSCPFCREPIINTYRYKDMVNKMLKFDINPIKEKVYGTDHQRSKKRFELLAKVKNLGDTQKLARENTHWNTAYNALRHVVGGKNKDHSVLHFDMYHIYLDILADVGDYYTKYIAENLTELKIEMRDQVKLICEALVTSKQKISEQQQVDIGQELKRTNSIVQLAKILGVSKSTTNPEVLEMAKTATEAVLIWSVYDEEKAVENLIKLEKAVELSGIASKEERAMIVKAIGLKAGHWYKCSNGHFYCIGECGGAMQLSRCPDCGAAIGGQSHKLTTGNQHAGEMDGSRFAAWSTGNNMANFRLD